MFINGADEEEFNPQKDMDFELLEEEEKGEELIPVQRILTLSQIRQRLSSADNPYKASIEHLKTLNNQASCITPFQKLTAFGDVTTIIKREIK